MKSDGGLVNCVIRVAGRKLVYHTIPVRTTAFYTGIEYSRGKIAIFPLPNDDLSEDQGLPRSWSCELVHFEDESRRMQREEWRV